MKRTTTFTFRNIHHQTDEEISVTVSYAGTWVMGIRKAARLVQINGFDWICTSHDTLTGSPRLPKLAGVTA